MCVVLIVNLIYILVNYFILGKTAGDLAQDQPDTIDQGPSNKKKLPKYCLCAVVRGV